MRVQFLKKYLNYVAGQFYTIDPKLAKGLISYGICIEIKEEVSNTEHPEHKNRLSEPLTTGYQLNIQPEQPEQFKETKRSKNKK